MSPLPIALSGFMGAGKSTVGARLARTLGWTFVDLDSEVAAAFARPVGAVFRDFGEARFREMEARLLLQAISSPGRVIALGGGAVCDPASREALLERSQWIHLDVSLRELKRRLARDPGDRPLWSDDIAALMERRAPFYAEAHFRIDGDRPPGRVTAAVEALVGLADARGPKDAGAGGVLHRVRIEGRPAPYDVVIGRGLLGSLPDALRTVGQGPIALITDWNVGPLHGAAVQTALEATGREVLLVTIPAGEDRKAMKPVLEAVDRLLDHGWQRSAPVVALGGGVLGDMAGLVAALTLRGVPLVQLPTTLLAMVDSSVGGKVGVNHRTGKNLLGAFWPPSLVWSDLGFLQTLPDRELRAGLGEALKTALLGDLELLNLLEERPAAVLARDPGLLAEVVRRCCVAKADVVSRDLREGGLRRVLNLGHTVGHAIERAAGYGTLLHGEAVAIGLVAAAEVAAWLEIGPASLPDRIRRACERLGLPTSAPPLPLPTLERALGSDKKLKGDQLAWVLLEQPGVPVVVELPLGERRLWLDVLQRSGVLSSRGA